MAEKSKFILHQPVSRKIIQTTPAPVGDKSVQKLAEKTGSAGVTSFWGSADSWAFNLSVFLKTLSLLLALAVPDAVQTRKIPEVEIKNCRSWLPDRYYNSAMQDSEANK